MAQTLRELLEHQIRTVERVSCTKWKAHEKEHRGLDKSIELARKHVDAKLLEMNEVRDQISKERGLFATVEALNAVRDVASTTRTQLALLAVLFVISVPVATTLIIWLLKPALE